MEEKLVFYQTHGTMDQLFHDNWNLIYENSDKDILSILKKNHSYMD